LPLHSLLLLLHLLIGGCGCRWLSRLRELCKLPCSWAT
jgi:hypothetical protein